MQMWVAVALMILGYTFHVFANVEKAIFVAPRDKYILPATLADLDLNIITPTSNAVRRQLQRRSFEFNSPEAAVTWYLLDDLTPDQRYEIRICWAATVGLSYTCPIRLSRKSVALSYSDCEA